MLVGYARVSTQDQNLDLQIDALKKAGCEKIFEDRIAGSSETRPGMDKLFEMLRKDDILVVWRLDRLGRSLKHLIEIVNNLEARGIAFKSLTESIDTSSSGGKLIFHIFGALAEFEKNIIRERTRAGLESARLRGRKGGRKPKLDEKKIKMLKALYESKEHKVSDLCKMFDIKKPTLYKYIKEV